MFYGGEFGAFFDDFHELDDDDNDDDDRLGIYHEWFIHGPLSHSWNVHNWLN